MGDDWRAAYLGLQASLDDLIADVDGMRQRLTQDEGRLDKIGSTMNKRVADLCEGLEDLTERVGALERHKCTCREPASGGEELSNDTPAQKWAEKVEIGLFGLAYLITQCTLLVMVHGFEFSLPWWVVWFPSLLMLVVIGVKILLICAFLTGAMGLIKWLEK